MAYIDDAGDFGAQGTPLACLVALVFTREDGLLARRRLRALVSGWMQSFSIERRPEIHCPKWIRDIEHSTGLTQSDWHVLIKTFIDELALSKAILVSIVLDKKANQPTNVEGDPETIVWHRLFEEVLVRAKLADPDRIEWRIDGRGNRFTEAGAKLVRTTCRESCGISPAVCGALPRYLNSEGEILIQAADVAVHFLYQALQPARSHLELKLDFDIEAFNPLCDKSVLSDSIQVRLPSQQ